MRSCRERVKLDLWRIRDQCCIAKIELGTELHKSVENKNKEGEHRHGGRCAFLKIQSVAKSFSLRQKPELEKGFTTAESLTIPGTKEVATCPLRKVKIKAKGLFLLKDLGRQQLSPIGK